MDPANQSNGAIVWFEPGQETLVRTLAERAGLRIIASGAAGKSALAGTQRIDDLRQALAGLDARVALLASSAGLGPSGGDAELARLARSRGVKLLTIEPCPETVATCRAMGPEFWMDACPPLGLFLESGAVRGLRDALETFGPVRSVSATFLSGDACGGLGSRLFDAMHLVHAMLGAPDQIDASVVTPGASSGVRFEVGDNLRTLRGELSANLRYAGVKCASLLLSDRGARWSRSATLLGAGGCVRVDESGIERVDAQGVVLERSARTAHPSAPGIFEAGMDLGAAEAFGASIERAVDQHAAKIPPFDREAVLAMCEAAILSASTGQPESPATILRMAGA